MSENLTVQEEMQLVVDALVERVRGGLDYPDAVTLPSARAALTALAARIEKLEADLAAALHDQALDRPLADEYLPLRARIEKLEAVAEAARQALDARPPSQTRKQAQAVYNLAAALAALRVGQAVTPDPQVVVDALLQVNGGRFGRDAAETVDEALPHAEAIAARIEKLEAVAEAARRLTDPKRGGDPIWGSGHGVYVNGQLYENLRDALAALPREDKP